MYTSFYTAARGVIEQQEKLNVVGNNLANVNNYGYKAKTAGFLDLMYYNLNNYNGEDTELKAGTGVVVEKTDTDFSPSGYVTTDMVNDYAIVGDGFFMLRNPENQEITYTRNGHFSLSQFGNVMFLVNDNGHFVLDQNMNPITVGAENTLSGRIGVYNFNILDGMENVGANEFQPTAKNGNPYLIPGADVRDKMLEMSNVSTADEISRMIITQRAYSFSLKMLQTSDEVVGTINNLRQ